MKVKVLRRFGKTIVYCDETVFSIRYRYNDSDRWEVMWNWPTSSLSWCAREYARRSRYDTAPHWQVIMDGSHVLIDSRAEVS